MADPPTMRLTNRNAMRATRGDPTDNKPSAARTVRTIRGHRAFCPLRACMERKNSAALLSAEHITAADQLRLLCDGARIGFSAGRDLSIPIQAVSYRPSTGPNRTALRQAQCQRRFSRCMQPFDAEQQGMIEWIILRNMSMRSWQLARGITLHKTVMQRLLVVLDTLVAYFDDEIRKHGLAA